MTTSAETAPFASPAASTPGRAPRPAAHGPVLAASLTLDGLLALDPPTLERLYREASVPVLGEVSGDLVGRMLALVEVPARVARLGHTLASKSWFPWRGKSFRALGADAGVGINRALSDRWPQRWFRFTTAVGPSRAGDFDAVQLDYDHPENPGFIRAIRDEIREVRPGLYLGQAYLHVGGSDRLVLYFALALPGRERA